MKSKDVDLLKIKELLNIDRGKSNDVFLEMLKSDLKRLLNEYFDIKNNIAIGIEKSQNLVVNIKFEAVRIKDVNPIPDMD